MKVEIEIRARGRTFNSKTIFFIRQLKSSPLFSPAFRLHIFLIFRKKPRLRHFFPPARANAARPKSSDQTAAAWTNKTQPHLIFAQTCRLKSNMKQKILPLPCPKKSGSLHWNRFFFAIYLPAYFPRLAKAAAGVGNIPAGILHIVCPVYYNGGVASRKVVRRDLLALRKAPKRLAVFGICQVGIVSGSPQIIVYRRGFLGGNLGKRRRCGGRQNRGGQC